MEECFTEKQKKKGHVNEDQTQYFFTINKAIEDKPKPNYTLVYKSECKAEQYEVEAGIHKIKWNRVLAYKSEFLKENENQNTLFMVQIFEFSKSADKYRRIVSFENFIFGDIMSGQKKIE